MHSRTLIILDPATTDIGKAVDEKLAPHKQLEAPEFVSGNWNYWHISEDDHFTTSDRPENLSARISELIQCTNYIDRKNETFYNVSSVIDIDGKWHDLQDFGWTMINRDNRNEEGLKLWRKHVIGIIEKAEGMLGVIITTHI
jgi:hypothetical protein